MMLTVNVVVVGARGLSELSHAAWYPVVDQLLYMLARHKATGKGCEFASQPFRLIE